MILLPFKSLFFVSSWKSKEFLEAEGNTLGTDETWCHEIIFGYNSPAMDTL